MFILINNVSAETNTTISSNTVGGIKGSINNYDTIYLNPGTYSGINNTNLTINKNMKIAGKGSKENIIINGASGSTIFQIENNVKVTFINITFRYGKITNSGNLSIDSCRFSECISTVSSGFGYGDGRGGGAILNSGSMVINKSVFTNCRSNYGGAICNQGNLSISGSNFTNNAARSGGSGDIAYHYGGAIYSTQFLYINSCNFINNTAYQGGSIFTYKGNAIINNSRLEDNEAICIQKVNGVYDGDGYGAGIFNYDCILTVENSIFRNYAYYDYKKSGSIAPDIHSNIDFILKNTSFRGGKAPFYLPSTTVNQPASLPTQNQNNSTNNTNSINKRNTYITISNLNGNYNKISRLNVFLTDEKGNKLKGVRIDLIIDGENYILTTDSNGLAYLDYKFTKTGKYTIQASYVGNSTLKSSTKTVTFTVPKYSSLKVKNTVVAKKKKFIYKSVLANLGYDKTTFKVSYKLPKGVTYVKPKISTGKISYNKNTRTLTWTISNLKVHKKSSAVLTWNLKAKKDKYSLKPKISKVIGLSVDSNNNLKFQVK